MTSGSFLISGQARFDVEPEIHPVKKGHGDEVTFKFKKENFGFEKDMKTTKFRKYKQT